MRRNGILLPIFSLPSPYGIGTLGSAAYNFVDFLQRAGQSFWQVLPIVPTSYGDSPYQSVSSYAGNPYFIDFDFLCEKGILAPEDYSHLNFGKNPVHIDYAALYKNRWGPLRKAFQAGFQKDAPAFEEFCNKNPWLEDYSLYMALKEKHQSLPYTKWPQKYIIRQKSAMDSVKKELKQEINFWKYIQFLFYEQWFALKKYANSRGIQIIGDIPIYVAADSADVWANPHLFSLDNGHTPVSVAGVPPDGFTPDGQMWGNPLYRWDVHKEDGYAWWLDRMRFVTSIYDYVRIDHFIGFAHYYSIPYGGKTARNGVWKKGPGIDFFNTLKKELPHANIIAEDLGELSKEAKKLLGATRYPGMKVLLFAFDQQEDSAYLPHNYNKKSVAYIGTHDNQTAVGWLQKAKRKDRMFAKQYLQLTRREGYHWGFIRGLLSSPAQTTIVQMQDVLGLGDESRTNEPSTLGTNWMWRMEPSLRTEDIEKKLYQYTDIYRRLPKKYKKGGKET